MMTSSLRMHRWNDVLLAINKSKENQRYCERLYKVVRCSKTHIRLIIEMLKKNNLIEVVPDRKIKWLALTEKGKKVILSLQTIRTELTPS